jgi:hypothetical protein
MIAPLEIAHAQYLASQFTAEANISRSQQSGNATQVARTPGAAFRRRPFSRRADRWQLGL